MTTDWKGFFASFWQGARNANKPTTDKETVKVEVKNEVKESVKETETTVKTVKVKKPAAPAKNTANKKK